MENGVSYNKALLVTGTDRDEVSVTNPLPTQLGCSVQTATIAAGASLSSAITKIGQALLAIQFPAALDGAVLTFQGSMDGTTYVEIKDASGTALSVTTVAASEGRSLGQLALDLAPWPYIKIRTGTSGSAQAQSAARTLQVGLA